MDLFFTRCILFFLLCFTASASETGSPTHAGSPRLLRLISESPVAREPAAVPFELKIEGLGEGSPPSVPRSRILSSPTLRSPIHKSLHKGTSDSALVNRELVDQHNRDTFFQLITEQLETESQNDTLEDAHPHHSHGGDEEHPYHNSISFFTGTSMRTIPKTPIGSPMSELKLNSNPFHQRDKSR
eukprot:11041_1